MEVNEAMHESGSSDRSLVPIGVSIRLVRFQESERNESDFRLLLKRVASLKDDYDRAEYYHQQHGRRSDEFQQEGHALRARNWRLEEELMALHHGNDWNAAARLARDEVAKLIADPKCGRRGLLEGLDAFVEATRTRAYPQPMTDACKIRTLIEHYGHVRVELPEVG